VINKQRFIVTCAVLGGVAVVLAIAGYFCGGPLIEWKMGVLGISQVIVRSPGEPKGVQLATALMFAWPAISTVAAVAIHRWRRRTDASALAVLAYFTVPVALLGGYIALRAHQMGELIEAGRGTGIAPMIGLLDLAPGAEEARLVVFASICVWIFIGVRRPSKF
jgi:hypothetical protein